MSSNSRIVYAREYNLGFPGSRHLHPFDGYKFSRAWSCIKRSCPSAAKHRHYRPLPATYELLRRIHTEQYLDELRSRRVLTRILELPNNLPRWLLERWVLRPMLWATGGTIEATRLAWEFGACVNLGGGFHHASRDRGEGFCVYADVPIAIEVWRRQFSLQRVMIIDLDAHQGNGFERIYSDDSTVEIFDVYNGDIYPQDRTARAAIRWDHCLTSGMLDADYLGIIEGSLPAAIDEFQPQIIFYIAGTDIFEADPLGQMGISAEGIFRRDCLVSKYAAERQIPLVMTLGGGYTAESYQLVARSVTHLLAS
ncbi:MAG: histone deacetylase [bacterium]|nr:histone deacetylase [bacterium]